MQKLKNKYRNEITRLKNCYREAYEYHFVSTSRNDRDSILGDVIITRHEGKTKRDAQFRISIAIEQQPKILRHFWIDIPWHSRFVALNKLL
jgi:hypothetical protein